MKRVGIEELEKHDITQVSGGQLQRAGICRALMNDPKIIFGDEPTGALNSKSAEEIMNIFTEINADRNNCSPCNARCKGCCADRTDPIYA